MLCSDPSCCQWRGALCPCPYHRPVLRTHVRLSPSAGAGSADERVLASAESKCLWGKQACHGERLAEAPLCLMCTMRSGCAAEQQ